MTSVENKLNGSILSVDKIDQDYVIILRGKTGDVLGSVMLSQVLDTIKKLNKE